MSEDTLREIRDLLKEIRDLQLPVADAYADAYQVRQAEREEKRLEAIRALISTEPRKKAWALANGKTRLKDISDQSGMTPSGASMFFKSLRDLGAVADDPPKRAVEV